MRFASEFAVVCLTRNNHCQQLSLFIHVGMINMTESNNRQVAGFKDIDYRFGCERE
jgi:hypothetical protein